MSIIFPSSAAITFGNILLASSTNFSGISSGQKCVNTKPLTLASLAIIAACSAVKCAFISGNPYSFNKLDSLINKSASCANSTSLLLAENEVSEVFDSNSDLIEQNTNLTDDNEKLRQANMKLFLQVGTKKNDSERMEESTGLKNNPPATKRDFNNLFDEKGGIK